MIAGAAFVAVHVEHQQVYEDHFVEQCGVPPAHQHVPQQHQHGALAGDLARVNSVLHQHYGLTGLACLLWREGAVFAGDQHIKFPAFGGTPDG